LLFEEKPTANTSQIPVLILFGPTASGKTGILFDLFGGSSGGMNQAEIISADSMQVYKGMDIGTAKPSPREREIIPHHLIDIRDPSRQFNAGDFVRLADEACRQIASRGKIPVVSGGTGFYLKTFILGLSDAPPSDKEIRRQLGIELKEKGSSVLMEELAVCDPVSARRIHINDEYRILRALEVYRTCGQPLSLFKEKSKTAPGINSAKRGCYEFTIIGLSRPREELYERINIRCDQMFKQGLAEEVRGLYEAGYTPDDPGLHAIGYREFFTERADFEDSSSDNQGGNKRGKWRLLQDAEGVKALVAQNSRRYAKRQITFFKGIPDVNWVECGSDDETNIQIKSILSKNTIYDNIIKRKL